MTFQLVLRAADVQKILNLCKSDSYRVIKEIKEDFPISKKLKGSKVRTIDLATAYELNVEDIARILTQNIPVKNSPPPTSD